MAGLRVWGSRVLVYGLGLSDRLGAGSICGLDIFVEADLPKMLRWTCWGGVPHVEYPPFADELQKVHAST